MDDFGNEVYIPGPALLLPRRTPAEEEVLADQEMTDKAESETRPDPQDIFRSSGKPHRHHTGRSTRHAEYDGVEKQDLMPHFTDDGELEEAGNRLPKK